MRFVETRDGAIAAAAIVKIEPTPTGLRLSDAQGRELGIACHDSIDALLLELNQALVPNHQKHLQLLQRYDQGTYFFTLHSPIVAWAIDPDGSATPIGLNENDGDPIASAIHDTSNDSVHDIESGRVFDTVAEWEAAADQEFQYGD